MLAGHKTIVPTDAHAKVSFRLIADQQPLDVQAAFRAYVEENTPPGITANVHFFGDGVQPYLVPLDDPALQAVASANTMIPAHTFTAHSLSECRRRYQAAGTPSQYLSQIIVEDRTPPR